MTSRVLLSQGNPEQARACLEALHEDVVLVDGPRHEVAVEAAEVLAMLRRELNGE
ncbi:hypothetical protein AB0P02_12580 [Streptomyces griseoluteus]|uniref:hypothetical protein n=1 Tax=Streptomyces griseoluteus TaxID=29306 RepID=UPI0034250155